MYIIKSMDEYYHIYIYIYIYIYIKIVDDDHKLIKYVTHKYIIKSMDEY